MRRRSLLQKSGVDWSKEYLTFTALESGTFQFKASSSDSGRKAAIYYSINGGNTWKKLASDTDSPTFESGQTIMWRRSTKPSSYYGIGTFTSSGRFTVEGNIMSLVYGDDFRGKTSLSGKSHAFYELFYWCRNLMSAEHLILPATTLAEQCYVRMFYYCTSLTTAPSVLPATTLAQSCYSSMFSNCTSLTTAPVLPATTLVRSCYSHMFMNCTSLTTAPVLPATTLVSACYADMFNGCKSLNYIKAMFTTIPGDSCIEYWVSDVASSGTFVKNSAATWNVTGSSGVPSGWTVQTASE